VRVGCRRGAVRYAHGVIRMRLKSRLEDWRRRRLLARHGIRVEAEVAVHRAGARSGVWPVVVDRMRRDSVVYSVGVGDNVAWELDLIERWGVTVDAFDPTPESVAWIAAQRLPAAFRFHPVGLASRDGTARFRRPRKVGRLNYLPEHDGLDLPDGSWVECAVRRLPSLCAELGHDRVDVLKLDIEGGEYAVLDDVLALRPEQLLVEFHHDLPSIGFERTCDALERISTAGYRVFDISERGLEFGFVRE